MVRRALLFAALDDEAQQALLAQMSSSRLERGDILFREGDQGDTLYVIGEGKVKLDAPVPTAVRISSPSSDQAKCSASCPCSTRGHAR